MKKASELGLETIELEDQVLLVDKNDPNIDRYIVDNGEIYGPYEKGDPLINYNGNIIASTKPLEALPLLVIEDDSVKLAWDYTEGNTKSRWAPIVRNAVVYGYNKAKETYKFTEKDMKGIFLMGLMENISNLLNEKTIDKEVIEGLFQKYLKSSTKKELWVNVHDRCKCGTTCEFKECRHEQKLKITNNQIKAVWK